ncbi:MAG TPA: hypothetical protein ENN81_05240 [Phycisphaerales bacterium]|nr:hypothetical protein [Phycisphaerales bacterium]
MPPGKRQQSNAMLYGLVICIFLTIIAIAFAVVFYIKAEEYKTNAATVQKDLDELANASELRNLGKLVGNKQGGESWMSLMVGYHDRAVAMITGGVAPATSAEVKDQSVKGQLASVITLAGKHIVITDPNTIGLVPIIQKLQVELANSLDTAEALRGELSQLQAKFDDAIATQVQERETLTVEKQQLQARVDEIQSRYDDIEKLLMQTADERAQTLMLQLDESRAKLDQTSQTLTGTQADLSKAETQLKNARSQLFVVSPPPDANAPAYKPDGKVILVDDLANVVHLDFGSDDMVYKGLTLSVYDRGSAITRETKPKAEIEVFDIYKNHCAAKITSGSRKRPILTDDLVANLIWDRGQVNVFTVTGDFDIDRDGKTDADGAERIRALVERWGGKAKETVTAETHFVIIGETPVVPKRPTFEDLELDPALQRYYDDAMRRLEEYKQAQALAKTLWIPVFKYETFLDFIGYNSQVKRPGAF